MISSSAWRILAALACVLTLIALSPVVGSLAGTPCAAADTASGEEKKAFDDAKSLGTVEAWDAFLSHYASGFYADLARAYVKKLAEPDRAPAQPAPAAQYPAVAGTWGGIVRSAPGQGNDRVASLEEGEQVTLLAPPVSAEPSDYPWFKIAFRKGQTGYMWGGILCSTGAERPDLFRVCPAAPVQSRGGDAAPAVETAKRAAPSSDRPAWCAGSTNEAETAICQNADLIRLDSVLNVAYQRAKSDSPKARAEIEQEQRKWLGRRNLCGNDPQCIRKRYAEQVQLLESYYGN